MPEDDGDDQQLTTAQLIEALPELRELLAEGGAYRWASEANRLLVEGEIEAMRSSEVWGYFHHVEMHRKRALDIVAADLHEHTSRGTTGR